MRAVAGAFGEMRKGQSGLGPGVVSSTVGSEAIRKSPRSLVRPLKPATTTPVPELVEILKMPWNGEVILSNPGIWPRNAETCPLAGIVRLPEKPAGMPESVVASRLLL